MAARRALGGGRVLGTGKSLAPPPVNKSQTPNSGLLSPSESSVSLNSQASSIPVSTENEGLTSRVALDEHASAQAAAAASSRMVCPICNEEMVSTGESCGTEPQLLTAVDDTSPTEQVGKHTTNKPPGAIHDRPNRGPDISMTTTQTSRKSSRMK